MILVVFITYANEATGASRKVAVYVTGEIPEAEKSIISSAVLGRLSGNKEYRVYERNEAFVDALNKEQDFQVSGEVPENEIRKVGQRMGVDYIIVVNAVVSDSEYCHMSARLMELTSGKILKTVNLKRKFTDSDVISDMANNIAYRLLNKESK